MPSYCLPEISLEVEIQSVIAAHQRITPLIDSAGANPGVVRKSIKSARNQALCCAAARVDEGTNAMLHQALNSSRANMA